MNSRGLLIAFEGGDGIGKSTQARLLAERLDAVLTRQAGGTPFGQKIRDLTLDANVAHISHRAEALLYMADRAEHIDQVIEPALDAGRSVVTDRYAYSSLVYQGFGRGLDVDELRELANWAMRGIWPDVVVLLTLPLQNSAERLSGRDIERDHYEAAGDSFHLRVAEGFLALSKAEPDRWRVVDGKGSVDEVAERVWDAVVPFTAAIA